MGIDNILERIAVDAEKSASDVTSEARKKATEIYAERTAEAKTASAEQIEAAEKEAINTINHIKSTAALESRKLILGAKRAVIDEVFDDIPSAFRRMPKDEYAAFLAGVAVKSSEKGTLYLDSATDSHIFKFPESTKKTTVTTTKKEVNNEKLYIYWRWI